MNKILIVLCSLLLVSVSVHSQEARPSNAAPDWFLLEIATLTAGTGRWVADNADYMGENEAYEAYATEWKAASIERVTSAAFPTRIRT